MNLNDFCHVFVIKKIFFLYIYKYKGRTYRSSVGRSIYLSQECAEMTRSSKTTDIYLAGESGDDIRWSEDIAIPLIKYI